MENDNQFADLWREAFTGYKKRTGRDILLEVSKSPDLQSVEGLQRMIEQTDKNFNAFRHRHAIWGYLGSVLKPAQLFTGLAQTAVSLTPFAPGKFQLRPEFPVKPTAEVLRNASHGFGR